MLGKSGYITFEELEKVLKALQDANSRIGELERTVAFLVADIEYNEERSDRFAAFRRTLEDYLKIEYVPESKKEAHYKKRK